MTDLLCCVGPLTIVNYVDHSQAEDKRKHGGKPADESGQG